MVAKGMNFIYVLNTFISDGVSSACLIQLMCDHILICGALNLREPKLIIITSRLSVIGLVKKFQGIYTNFRSIAIIGQVSESHPTFN